MKQSQVLFKKEWMEFIRSYRFLIIGCLFLFFAFSSPLMAKFMPEIVGTFLPEDVAKAFPDPTAFDSWAQFFKNISQIGLFVFVIVFGSILTSERQSGTLILSITKGLKRSTVINVKFVFTATVWTVSYLISFLITYAYTLFYWPKDEVQQLFLANFSLWLFGILLIALILLGNVLFRTFIGTLLMIVGFIILLFIISFFPKLENIQILRLATENNAMLKGLFTFSDYTSVIILTVCLIIGILIAAIQLFNRKEI